MNKIKTLLLILFISNFCFSQEGENPLPYAHVESNFDVSPQYPGGSKAMLKYFEDSVRYPEPEKTKGLQGNVYLKCIITKKGIITKVEATNGIPYAPNLVKEGIRLIQAMPKWKPATKKGKAVDAEYNLSVSFKIKY